MKHYLLGARLLAPGLVSAQTPFIVKGTIGKLNSPAKVYRKRGGRVRNSPALVNGAFELQGTMERPREAQLVLQRQGRLRSRQREQLMLFLEPGPIVVSSPEPLPTARVTGGPLTKDYQWRLAARKPISDQAEPLSNQKC